MPSIMMRNFVIPKRHLRNGQKNDINTKKAIKMSNDLLKVLVCSKEFCEQNSCGLAISALNQAIDIATFDMRNNPSSMLPEVRKGDWIQVFSGGKFYPLDPRPNEIDIIDIAHALSNICRFTGHSSEFYSVAQHSVLVSQHVQAPENALWGLLHDAAEAYICDLARPVKRMPQLDPYVAIEDAILKVITHKFGLPLDEPMDVKTTDALLLRTEARDLHLITPEWNHYYIKPLDMIIKPLLPKEAEKLFLDRFNELNK
jgi:uncharacterized protein